MSHHRSLDYAQSIDARRGVGKVCGWIKTFGDLHQFKLQGQENVSAVYGLQVIARTLICLGNRLLAQPSPQK